MISLARSFALVNEERFEPDLVLSCLLYIPLAVLSLRQVMEIRSAEELVSSQRKYSKGAALLSRMQ